MPLGKWGANFKECVSKASGWAENPEGFCNWIEHGGNKDRADADPDGDGDQHSSGMKYRCDRCDQMVDVSYGDNGPVYDAHGDCPGSGMPLHVPSKMDSVERVRRFDYVSSGNLRAPERMDNGWLKTEGRIARIGIQEYRDADGKVLKELRLPEEVFDSASLASFQQVPVTNQHPPEMLNAQNAKKYAVGSLGENIRADGDFVVAPIILTDAEAIAAAEAGRSQLSNGYTCSLDPTQDREYIARYGEYDFIQRNIRGNHCAMVDYARAGVEARMRLDAKDAISGIGKIDLDMLLFKSGNGYSEKRDAGSEKRMLHPLKFDGLTYEVTDQNAQAQHDRFVAGMKKQHDELSAKFDLLQNQIKEDAAAVVEFNGSKITVAEIRDSKKLAAFLGGIVRQAANVRADLIVEARKHLPASEKLDTMADDEIKKAVALALNKDQKLDDKSPEYINVLYDLSIAAAAKKVSPTQVDAVRAFAAPTQVNADQLPAFDPAAAQKAMVQRALASNVKHSAR